MSALVPMHQAVEQVQHLLALAEEAEADGKDITDLDLPFTSNPLEDFAGAVDRRIMLMKNLKTQAAILEETIAAFGAAKRRLESIHEKVEGSTMAFMRANPNLEFKGRFGALGIQTNGGKIPLKYKAPIMPGKVERVVSPEHYPAEWLEEKTVHVLKPGFEDEVRAGRLAHALIEPQPRGHHLRIKV